MAEVKTKKPSSAPKAGSNSLEHEVIANLPQAVKSLKGVISSMDAHTVVFTFQRPHTSKFMSRNIPLERVVTLTGEVGKPGEIQFLDNLPVAKRKGNLDYHNGFIRVTGEDKAGNRQVTMFNPKYTEASAMDVPAPANLPLKKNATAAAKPVVSTVKKTVK